ncbi:MAG: DUF1059 domain-containing protein [Actinobacteria bacterium]|nr:DUF1059 domain-containing protein [Actinomycetota bacterium]
MDKPRPATYQFACKHLYADCSTTISAKSEDEVRRRAQRHLEKHHGARASDDETVRKLMGAIRPA